MTTLPLGRESRNARLERLITLIQGGIGLVEQLATELQVSPSTVRRDLAELTSQGRVARTYGGAITRTTFQERPIAESASVRERAKLAIASTAVSLVPDDATIFVDAGTTCLAITQRLHERRGLTVVTRGLEVGIALASSPSIEVILIGGTVRRLSHGLVGSLSRLAVDRLSFEVSFLGADAVDPLRGIGEPTLEETLIKERVAQVSSQLYVVGDSSKVGGESQPPAWTHFDRPWTFITDDELPSQARAEFHRAGIELFIAVD